MKQVSVPADGACFFHSIMFHIHPELVSQPYDKIREATDSFRQSLCSSVTLHTLQASNIYSPLFDQVFVSTLETTSGMFEKDKPEYLISTMLNLKMFKQEFLPKCLENRERIRPKIVKDVVRILEKADQEKSPFDILSMLREIDNFVGKLIETTDEIVLEFMKEKFRKYTEWADHYMITYTSHYLKQGIIVVDENDRIIMNSTIPYFDKPPIYLRNINNAHFELLVK